MANGNHRVSIIVFGERKAHGPMTAPSDIDSRQNFAAGIGSVLRLVVHLRETTPLVVQIPRKMRDNENTFAASVAIRPRVEPGAQRAASGDDGWDVWRGREADPSGAVKQAVKAAGGDSANLGNPCAVKESRIRRGEYRGTGGYLLREIGLACRCSTILHNVRCAPTGAIERKMKRI